MTITADERAALETAEHRLRAILPEEYQDSYEDVQPVSMGSAGLKYGADGKVAWNEMWATFCDLAMAGGPPHKGTLLEPAPRAAIDAHPHLYAEVVEEICRGVTLVTGLPARESTTPGWIRVFCRSGGMAGWLVRAIVMENVSARHEGPALELPAGPHYRVEKEIKNVITVIAKTAHYWTGHMWNAEQRFIADLFSNMAAESPLIEPAFPASPEDVERCAALSAMMAGRLARDTGLRAAADRYAGWFGVECASVRAAVWMMRTLVASNVLARREGTVLFVPVNPSLDPDGSRTVQALARVHRFAVERGVS